MENQQSWKKVLMAATLLATGLVSVPSSPQQRVTAAAIIRTHITATTTATTTATITGIAVITAAQRTRAITPITGAGQLPATRTVTRTTTGTIPTTPATPSRVFRRKIRRDHRRQRGGRSWSWRNNRRYKREPLSAEPSERRVASSTTGPPATIRIVPGNRVQNTKGRHLLAGDAALFLIRSLLPAVIAAPRRCGP